MSDLERELHDRRWRRAADTQRQAVIARAEGIHFLNNRGSAFEALEAEHDAVELVLQNLREAVLSGANRAEVIEILNTSIDLCATHFADEEEFMPKNGYAHLDTHVAAHKQLLAQFVEARRNGSGEDLPLATLDVAELLHAFHRHVETYDRMAQPSCGKTGKVRTAPGLPPVPGQYWLE
jgi:hemerythrin-like metal-binding protein